MRLAACYHCNTLSKLPDYPPDGNPDHDATLQDWIDRHLHGYHPDDNDAPKGQLYQLDESRIAIDAPSMRSHGQEVQVAKVVEAIQGTLSETTKRQWEVRDEVKEDALACFQKHGRPEVTGRKCIDYKSSSKLLGRRNLPKEQRVYLCSTCPYEEGVRVELRWKAGQYK